MDNYYQELMHFVTNNVDEVICRNWANDLRANKALLEAAKGALQAIDGADAVHGEDALYDAGRDLEKAIAKVDGDSGNDY